MYTDRGRVTPRFGTAPQAAAMQTTQNPAYCYTSYEHMYVRLFERAVYHTSTLLVRAYSTAGSMIRGILYAYF